MGIVYILIYQDDPGWITSKKIPSENHKNFSERLCTISTGDLHTFGLCKLHALRPVGRILCWAGGRKGEVPGKGGFLKKP